METVGAEMKSNDSAEWGAKTAKFGCDVGLATSDPHTMKAQFEGESAEDVQYPRFLISPSLFFSVMMP